MTSKTHTKAAGALALVAFVLLLVLAPSAQAEGCANEAIREAQHSTFLPDCRAYEMVSPPEKNGGELMADSTRTSVSADGSQIVFSSHSAFAEPYGAALTNEYLAERSSYGAGAPGTGWVTHAIAPLTDALTFAAAAGGTALDPGYLGEFTPDLGAGVFATGASKLIGVAEDPDVAHVPNLYMRTDLHSVGEGSYRLITACPRCREKDDKEGAGKGSLPEASTAAQATALRPTLAAIGGDGSKVLFESPEPLTADAPLGALPRLYESENGNVRLVGRIPSGSAIGCDDIGVPACKGAEVSLAGQGAMRTGRFPVRVLSDGSDGHSRVFFTAGPKTSQLLESGEGALYLREDGHRTVKINVSERTDCGITNPGETPKVPPACTGKPVEEPAGPAVFWDASANGERVFFTATQALTDDTPSAVPSNRKLYMYDATKPASDPHKLTLVSIDREPADSFASGGNVIAVIGASSDGHYVYFRAMNQLVAGAPLLESTVGTYLWHDGAIYYITDAGLADGNAINSALPEYEARVTPDGRYLLYQTARPADNDFEKEGTHGDLYLYDVMASTATEPSISCVSCSSDPANDIPFDTTWALAGSSGTVQHESKPLSDEGRYVFFTTEQGLVPQDVNEKDDAYEYDVQAKELHLLSTGTSEKGSLFFDASSDGSNAFIVTDQRLVGGDPDGSYDLYDVRTGGGFPEPQPPGACASSMACQGPLGPPAAIAIVGSTAVGSGNPPLQATPGPAAGCPKGQRVERVKGRARCVKSQSRKRGRRHRHARRHRAHGRSKRGGGK